jgi:serine/threonine protein phosphatase PrpC
VELVASSATDVGRSRSLNEDALYADPGLGLFVVCDGMGGHAAGEVASRLTIDTLAAHVRASEARLGTADAAAQVVREGIEKACATLYDQAQADKNKRGMGTTCTALLVRGGKGVMGHVGDSRLYLLRQGQLYQMNEDHSFLAEAVKHGMLTPEQASRSTHTNVVTRAVGPYPTVQVDTLVFDVLAGDTLLLCSDGLHQYYPNALEIAELLGQNGIEDVPSRLVATANARGGLDNITAIVVRAQLTRETSLADSKRASEIQAQYETLRRIELFREMTMPELARVLHSVQTRDVAAGDVVLREGESTENLFMIVDGGVRVQRGGQTVADLGAGSHFGEMALLNQRPRTATVIARMPTRLLVLERSAFFQVAMTEPVIAAKFVWKLAQTLSLRLDDVYLLQDRAGETSPGGAPAPEDTATAAGRPPGAEGACSGAVDGDGAGGNGSRRDAMRTLRDLGPPPGAAVADDGAGAGQSDAGTRSAGDAARFDPRATARFGTFPSPFAPRG